MRKDLLKPAHNHAEAFCMMKYTSNKNPRKFAEVIIWNSRDGVTPFIFFDETLGMEFQHSDFKSDLYAPDYKPVKGDLIWATYDEVTGRKAMLRQFEIIKEHAADPKVKEINEYHSNKCQEHVNDPEAFILEGIKKLMDEKQPVLVLVENDWK